MQLSCSKKNLFSKQCYFCVLVNSMGERGRKKYFVNYFLFKLVNFFTFVIYICLGWTRQWDIDWCFTWRRGHLQGSTSGEQCPLVRTDYLDITGHSTLLRRGGEDAWCSVNLTCCNLVFLKQRWNPLEIPLRWNPLYTKVLLSIPDIQRLDSLYIYNRHCFSIWCPVLDLDSWNFV